MKFLLIMLLATFQDPAPGNARTKPSTVENLVEDLDSNDPATRDAATSRLIERENSLEKYKAIFNDTLNPEVKWRLKKVIISIEANQKFRAMTTLSPLITIKYEGTMDTLFSKLTELTGQKLDARAFGDNNVKIDCTNAPLFQVLDLACKQIGYDWEVNYRDKKGDVIDIYQTSPISEYTNAIELTGVGMSDKTPGYAGQPFKIQTVQTSFGINNKFGEVVTEAVIQFKYAADPGLKFAVGPKIKYTKIVTDKGVELLDRSAMARYALVSAPPTTHNISFKGKATYRFPMKVETIELNIDALHTIKPNANGDCYLDFADRPEFRAQLNNGNISIHAMGHDNLVKERFTGPFTVKKKGGTVILERGTNNSTSSGYINVYEDYFQFYIYGTPSGDDAVSLITFEYITEFRDLTFDFAIDNIPLY